MIETQESFISDDEKQRPLKNQQQPDADLEEINFVLQKYDSSQFISLFQKHANKAISGLSNKKDNEESLIPLRKLLIKMCPPFQMQQSKNFYAIPEFMGFLIEGESKSGVILQIIETIIKILPLLQEDEIIKECLSKILSFLSLRRDAQVILLLSKDFQHFICQYFKQMNEWSQVENCLFLTISNILSHPQQYSSYQNINISYAQILLRIYQFYLKSEEKENRSNTLETSQNKTLPDDGRQDELLQIEQVELVIDFSFISAELSMAIFSLPNEFLEKQPDFRDVFLFAYQYFHQDDKLMLQYKSLILLGKLCLIDSERQYMIQELKIMNLLEQLMEKENTIIKREILTCLQHFVKFPNQMIFWLKGDSNFLGMDSSNANDHIQIIGNPDKIKSKGLYEQNWGISLKDNDCLRIIGEGITLPYTYFISAWFFYKPSPEILQKTAATKFKNPLEGGKPIQLKFKTLFSCRSVPFLQIDPEESGWIIVDDKLNARYIKYNFEKECLHGWNLLFLNVDNNSKSLELFINNRSISKIKNILARRNITEIGNSANGDQAIGQICDIRIYNRCLQYEEISKINYKTLQNPCEIAQEAVYKSPLLKIIMEHFLDHKQQNNFIILGLLQLIIYISAYQPTRMNIISYEFQNSIIKYLNSSCNNIKLYAYRALVQLK